MLLNDIDIYRTPLSGVGEARDIRARLRKNQRTPPARLQGAFLISKIEEHLKVGLAALSELIVRRDRRGDDLAVPERLDHLDALVRIARAGRPNPGPNPLLA